MKTPLPTLEQLNDESFVKELEYMRTLLTGAEINEEAAKHGDGDVIADTCDNIAGIVPYRLYAHLSTLFDDGVILDIGTLYGSSALALSYNTKNHVKSYDLAEKSKIAQKMTRENIDWNIMDFRKDESIEWDKVKMIVIDTNHTGEQEVEFMKFLIEKDWKGIMCFDDINLNRAMIDFWECFDDDIKKDVSELGHGVFNAASPHKNCGTGFVEFDLE
jgi:hypothetical protein